MESARGLRVAAAHRRHQLDQPQAPQACMAFAPDHDMVVQQDVELLQRGGAGLGDGEVVAGWRRIAAGVVVDDTIMLPNLLVFKAIYRVL